MTLANFNSIADYANYPYVSADGTDQECLVGIPNGKLRIDNATALIE